uniref:Transmembrane protein 100-like n=1 Tax=Labrus bergylta TaxID=56723 RepID=A0A3Q3FPI2_9LABR
MCHVVGVTRKKKKKKKEAKESKPTMATKMETLDASALSDVNSTVTYDPKADTVTLPGGVVSLAGITVVTGGAELSCGSCMLAFGSWGTIIGFSCVAVGLWDQLNQSRVEISHLLSLGLVILALSLLVVGSVVAFYLLTKKKREMRRAAREDGKEILVESERVIKKVTV